MSTESDYQRYEQFVTDPNFSTRIGSHKFMGFSRGAVVLAHTLENLSNMIPKGEDCVYGHVSNPFIYYLLDPKNNINIEIGRILRSEASMQS